MYGVRTLVIQGLLVHGKLQDSYQNLLVLFSYNISHKGMVFLCRMRCGHTSLLESLFRFSIVPSPNCPACDTLESMDHIFWQCSRFVEQRNSLIKRLTKSIGLLPILVRSLFVHLDEDTVYAVDFFIN